MASSTNVFVYGTLKKGKSAHKFLKDCEFRGDYDIAGTMYGHGKVSYPMIKLGGDYRVHGEIYHVPEDVIGILDRYEGHPHLYKRQQLTHEDGWELWVYEYQGDVSGMDVITSGVF